MIGKFIVVSLAVLGAFLLLPLIFPTLHHTAWQLGTFGLTWSMIVAAGVFGLGMKLSAK